MDNDGFVGATAPIPITHLKEDMISLQDNLKYSIVSVKTVLDSVPQGSQFHRCTSRVLNYLTAANELSSSTVATTGTASVTLLDQGTCSSYAFGPLCQERKKSS